MKKHVITPYQTVGPFFKIGLEDFYKTDIRATQNETPAVIIRGAVFDGDQKPIPDAVLEFWQADRHGQYVQNSGQTDSVLAGFGRVPTDENGHFAVTTIRPGATLHPSGKMQAPHVAVMLFMRGLLYRLITRVYFPGEALNDQDPVLSSVDPVRRDTLIAKTTGSDQVLAWNIITRGAEETVFFDI